ncbi:MAG: hypothetical protein IIT75_01325, partial [Candidatus Methanomethylophilus sp.]|nr:hypothetical protein [Methanomethylophilus sp.]
CRLYKVKRGRSPKIPKVTESEGIFLFLSFLPILRITIPSSSVRLAENLHDRTLLRTGGLAVISVLSIHLKPASFSLIFQQTQTVEIRPVTGKIPIVFGAFDRHSVLT